LNIAFEEIANGKLKILNTLGQVIYENEVNMAESRSINITNWSKGVYLLQWQTATENTLYKFIKE
jgi:hypothetical protein